MKNLKELEKEGKKTLKELEEQTRKEQGERSKQLVEMIANKEGVDFNELWAALESRRINRGYLGSHQIRFSIAQYAPIEYWLDSKDENKGDWFVYTAIPRYFVKARNLGEALVIAKRAYEEQPWEFERTVVK